MPAANWILRFVTVVIVPGNETAGRVPALRQGFPRIIRKSPGKKRRLEVIIFNPRSFLMYEDAGTPVRRGDTL